MSQHDYWNKLASHWRGKYAERIQKIPLDAGASCPNRDGTLSRSGCLFCNPEGSGSGLGLSGLGLEAQWLHWRAHYLHKGKSRLFIAYLQSFSNTYGPIERLAEVLESLHKLPDMIGLSVGTRPDCIDPAKVQLLAAQPWPELWLELGAQSCHNDTLKRINRGHSRECTEEAVNMAANQGLQVCLHLMAGLPGETKSAFLDSVRWANTLPIQGVKLHNVYISHNSPLAAEHTQGLYTPLEQAAYVDMAAEALCLLRPDIIVHRATAAPAPGELLLPDWANRNWHTENLIVQRLKAANKHQGNDWLPVSVPGE